ncbi:hypothetical protein FB45DRAFT_929285 [Roridomyces roridus]|uniref:Secreted protein n=1 Tax=Roridomyces roridus TaxID=1738132 RepID=A0AAD7BHV0_9AGAR|nr:hypothetical protein FB45DRAFT_929285 [Roridomyces roridus]
MYLPFSHLLVVLSIPHLSTSYLASMFQPSPLPSPTSILLLLLLLPLPSLPHHRALPSLPAYPASAHHSPTCTLMGPSPHSRPAPRYETDPGSS